jgi:hypothetical protein
MVLFYAMLPYLWKSKVLEGSQASYVCHSGKSNPVDEGEYGTLVG